MKRKLPVLLALIAPTLFAADGQVLINQSTVTAAGGFPYRIKTAGSYKLSGNLLASLDKQAIVIDASEVVLDLNGFNVSCTYDDADNSLGSDCITDNRQPLTGITIRNGSVYVKGSAAHFNYGVVTGINLLYSKATTVEYIHFGASLVQFSANGLDAGVQSIVRYNIFTDDASPNFACPTLVEGNVNNTPSQGANGTGCVYVNNINILPL